jgi:hypothetical protein
MFRVCGAAPSGAGLSPNLLMRLVPSDGDPDSKSDLTLQKHLSDESKVG